MLVICWAANKAKLLVSPLTKVAKQNSLSKLVVWCWLVRLFSTLILRFIFLVRLSNIICFRLLLIYSKAALLGAINRIELVFFHTIT